MLFLNAIKTKIIKISNFAKDMINVLYIHGMGGGADSRIPSILSEALADKVSVIARTYDFDPEVAALQIRQWVDELKPRLIIGESLGSMHALRIKGVPHLFVSPALNASFHFEFMAWLCLIPGVTRIFDSIYKPREGDRQKLHFTFRILRKYRAHRRAALATSKSSADLYFAFIGTDDHYRKNGVVSLKSWRKHFGNAFQIYNGTHFMEEEHIYALLIPKICEVLNIK